MNSVKRTKATISYPVSLTRLWSPHLFLRIFRTSAVSNDVLPAGQHTPYEFYVRTWSTACGSPVKNKVFKNTISFWCCQHAGWFSVNAVDYAMLFHLTSLFKTEILLIYSRQTDWLFSADSSLHSLPKQV